MVRNGSGEIITGKVFVIYVINPDGRATHPIVLRSSDDRLNDAARKAISAGRFEPAKLKGNAIPTIGGMATLVDSWHILEQSGRLLVPKARTKSWKRNAVSLLARPDV